MNGSLSIPKTLSNINKSGYVLKKDDNTSNAEAPSIRKRKAGAFSAEKHPKWIRQGSIGISWEREVTSNHSCNQSVSPLSVSPNRFCFSANIDEKSELADNVRKGEFLELTEKHPLIALKNPKFAES